jgi:hypothetical protein
MARAPAIPETERLPMTQAGDNAIKLNLGSGQNPIPGWINVDKFGEPDVKWDLEQFPWPWPDNSVGEINMTHVLEHLGRTPEIFFKIVQELYRVCRHGAIVHIAVPHPRHDEFLNDPTHVRIVTPVTWTLFSKERNLYWKQNGFSNSPLAVYYNVDFEILENRNILDPYWSAKLASGEIKQEDLAQLSRQYTNVIKETRTDLRVLKLPTAAG